ncbi:hypothetical protein B0H19DRAFT_711230 [Mycena capillaripes]|nr:hypothetical protein B0H19DRAFT_711230 [Mycena capillaripes]
MIPFKDFLHRYRDSHSIIVYLYGYWSWDFHQASEYFQRTFQTELLPHTSQLWIRSSTGLLCADPMDYTSGKAGCAALAPSPTSQPHPFAVLHETEPHVTPLISSMSLELYYFICWWHFADSGFIAIPVSETVRLGAIVLYPSGKWREDSAEIAAFTESVSLSHFAWEMNSCATVGEPMDTGWTRFRTSDGMGARDSLTLCIEWVKVDTSISRRAWFSQANHAFSLLHVNSNHHHYVLTHDCEFQLNLISTSEALPAGYLFICPPEDLRAGPSSFRWPDCAAYWSRDPEGVERLAVDEAARLGFPAIQLQTKIHGSWWNGSVYAGLRKFHEEKGFDPDSQDVARHLEYPLLEVYDPLAPFAFIEAEDSDAEEGNEGNKTLDSYSEI